MATIVHEFRLDAAPEQVRDAVMIAQGVAAMQRHFAAAARDAQR